MTGVWLGNDDNSPTKKATGGGLPVEIWTRFMKAAHQGVTPAPLPASQQPGGLLTTIAQAVSPADAARPSLAVVGSAAAPVRRRGRRRGPKPAAASTAG